ncbi:sigma-54-dependent transcriptional regulator [Flavisolibacter tropicus]|uniref:Chemotaxis protein CheY n=1 Tax=Flavisolibacter tropicus TaxID=1492898 RepID=A0A172TST0_9BACT|nr:sigma-54 dependent transcriptional regulator [Flavisolibacter tropicus]ANE50090.1 chemotaxis protein CheY [Flavisolibacter tropicus]
MQGSILIIDDEEQLRKLLSRIIGLEGYKVEQAGSLKEGLGIVKRKDVDILLCDVKLPDGNGVEFIKEVKKLSPLSEVILLTAFGNIIDGVQAIKNGAFDYITKGNDNDRILPLLSQAMGKVIAQKKAAVKINTPSVISFDSIAAESKSIQQAVSLAKRIAPTDATVLLLGETGTGKEVFANAIHVASKRKDHPYIALNCSAFAKDLLESELFGHRAGAFTGASKDKKGLIEMADGGTLFLDEIGELHPDLQAKLLRVLENGEYIKLGDTRVSKVNVRIIAATNRSLEKEIETGHFREDLYYRLNAFTIQLPPLRERLEDIETLSQVFLKQFSQQEGKQLLLSKEAIQLLKSYSWKGNIRELRNVMQRAVILTDESQILPMHLPYELQHRTDVLSPVSLAAVEKQHIQKILAYTNGNKTQAAKILGIGLVTLYRKLDEYELPK